MKMKKVLWPVFVCLLTAALASSSCTQNVPESPPKTETETTTTAAPPTPEPKPPIFSVSGLTITPKEVTAGSSVTIEVLVTNMGELSGTYDVTLKIDETVEATEKVTLKGAASQKVTFILTKSTAKTYLVSIDGISDTFVVKSTSPQPPVVKPPTPPLPPLDTFMKGIWFNDWGWGFDKPRPPLLGPLYYPPQADASLKSLATTGANWISVVICIFQETLSSTNITSNQYKTASDDAVKHIVDLAHSLGIRVVLVPFVNLSNDPDHSWVQIGSAFTSETQWQGWFASYREHINHYASFAQETGADMFYVGSELPGTTHREDDWRQVVKEVRELYKGQISYDSVYWGNPTPEYKRIKWWDAVDYIATDFWLPLTNKNDPTVEELKQGWINTGWMSSLEAVSKQFNKPAILSEIGFNNFDGVNRDPSGIRIKDAPEDLQEQADCYEATLEVVMGRDWLKGIFWWQWNAISVPTPWPGDPHGKPAEDILRKFYLADDKPK